MTSDRPDFEELLGRAANLQVSRLLTQRTL